jgi:hypothetical protein
MRKKQEEQVAIQELHFSTLKCHILGTSALIMHRFPFKAWQELIYPSIRENRASLEQKLKHDPWSEYRSAFYTNRDEKRPTMFHIPNGMIHGSLASAALDNPGAKKAQIERLTKVVDVNIDLYGVPAVFCAMVRNSDMSRTPDVRTRPIFPKWACSFTISFMRNLTERGVTNLLAAAGKIDGIGDWRGEKGGPFGAFEVVNEKDARFLAVKKHGARAAQKKALERPAFFDDDTADILRWFDAEIRRREMGGLLKNGSGGPPHKRTILERGGDGDGEYQGEVPRHIGQFLTEGMA